MAESASKFPEERQQAILRRLRERGRVVAMELAQEFATSEDTIRRDLRELVKAGLCQRTYGGAITLSPASGTFSERRELRAGPKAILAPTAVGLIKPGQFVFLDASTTNLEIARVLPANQGLTVAANAPSIALAALGRPSVSVIMIGGVVNPFLAATFGARAVRDVQALSIDLLFLGVCALSAEQGLSAFDLEDAEFKRVLMEQSNVVAATITSDKLETVAPFQIASLEEIDHLILEHDADPNLLKPLKRPGLSIHQAPPG